MNRVDPVLSDFLVELQRTIVKNVRYERLITSKLKSFCGVDVSYGQEKAVAAAVIWDSTVRRVVKVSTCSWTPFFPYVPGLLFLREAPIMVEAVRRLNIKPELILVDGHGIAHPRRAGVAVFVGLILKTPTLGVAKSLLTGEVGSFKEGFASISSKSEVVGYAIKSTKGRIFYASPGYGLTVEDVLRMLHILGVKYPMVLEEADRLSREAVKVVESH